MRSLILLTAVQLFLLFNNGIAQYISWEQPIEVSSANGNYRPRIGVCQDSVAVICWGNPANSSIQFSRKVGNSFTAPVQLNPSGTLAYVQDWTGPEMAVSGNSIYIVFKLEPISSAGIYMVHSNDGGLTFSDTVRIDPNFGNIPWVPAVEVNSSGEVIVAYMENDFDWSEPRFVTQKSIDGGLTFLPPVDATRLLAPGEVCDCCPPSLTTGAGKTFVLFRNNENNLRNIYASVSNDNAASFDTTSRLDLTSTISSSCQSTGPDGFVLNDSLYTVWRAYNGGYRVMISSAHVDSLKPVVHKKIWGSVPSTSIQNYPKVANEGNLSAVVWQETMAVYSAEIIISYDSTGTPSRLGSFRDTVNVQRTGFQINPDIKISGGEFYITWQDNNNGKIYFRSGTPAAPLFSGDKLKQERNLFPNPFNNGFSLEIKSGETATLTDLSGKVLLQELNSGYQDMSLYSDGIYLLNIKTSEGNIQQQLFKNSLK